MSGFLDFLYRRLIHVVNSPNAISAIKKKGVDGWAGKNGKKLLTHDRR